MRFANIVFGEKKRYNCILNDTKIAVPTLILSKDAPI